MTHKVCVCVCMCVRVCVCVLLCSPQLAGLLARHYATEYEHQALVTKKLPTVTPHDAKVMARYGIQAQ